MSTVFILQNQKGLFLNKQREWVDGREAATLYRSEHKDEAVNQMIEVNAKDYTLRIKVIECPLSERRQPQLNDIEMPSSSTAAESEERLTPLEAEIDKPVSLFAPGAVSPI